MKKISFIIVAFILSNSGISQTPNFQQQRLQAFQEAADQNEKHLHQYQWIETTTVTLSGNTRPPNQAICHYTAYGTLSRTSLGPQQSPPPLSGGPLRRHIEEKKIKEAQQAVASVWELTARYIPMNPSVFKQSLQVHRVDFEYMPDGRSAIVINDYVKPGDKFTLELYPATMKLRRVIVNSYFGSTSEPFVASVDFAMLEDGTIHPSITKLDAPSKHLIISTVSSNFSIARQSSQSVN